MRELGPEVLRGLELQISTQVSALRSQRARYLQSVNAALTAVGQHKSISEAKIKELSIRAAETGRIIASRAPPMVVPPPLASLQTVTSAIPTVSTRVPPPDLPPTRPYAAASHSLSNHASNSNDTPPAPPHSVGRLGDATGTRMSLSARPQPNAAASGLSAAAARRDTSVAGDSTRLPGEATGHIARTLHM